MKTLGRITDAALLGLALGVALIAGMHFGEIIARGGIPLAIVGIPLLHFEGGAIEALVRRLV